MKDLKVKIYSEDNRIVDTKKGNNTISIFARIKSLYLQVFEYLEIVRNEMELERTHTAAMRCVKAITFKEPDMVVLAEQFNNLIDKINRPIYLQKWFDGQKVNIGDLFTVLKKDGKYKFWEKRMIEYKAKGYPTDEAQLLALYDAEHFYKKEKK